MKKKIADRISDTLEIPRDIIANMPRVVITGNGMVHIEGFSGIEEYESERITVRVKEGMVSVAGAGLSIDEITEEYINLKGVVKTVEFM